MPCCTWLRQIGECATRLAYGSEWCRSYFVEGFFCLFSPSCQSFRAVMSRRRRPIDNSAIYWLAARLKGVSVPGTRPCFRCTHSRVPTETTTSMGLRPRESPILKIYLFDARFSGPVCWIRLFAAHNRVHCLVLLLIWRRRPLVSQKPSRHHLLSPTTSLIPPSPEKRCPSRPTWPPR